MDSGIILTIGTRNSLNYLFQKHFSALKNPSEIFQGYSRSVNIVDGSNSEYFELNSLKNNFLYTGSQADISFKSYIAVSLR